MHQRDDTKAVREAIEYANANPGRWVLYLCANSTGIMRFIWDEFFRECRRQDIKGKSCRLHRIDLDNGSTIRLIRQDDEHAGHGLLFDKIVSDTAAVTDFWRDRIRGNRSRMMVADDLS